MTRPLGESSGLKVVAHTNAKVESLARRPAPEVEAGGFTPDWALLAIPDGQTIADGSLDVVTNYNRSDTSGTALTLNATTGLITFVEEGIYDIHTWAEMDSQGAWVVVEGPVFQAGQDFQDIGNGLLVHTTHPNGYMLQHKTTIVVADLPQSVNLQVLHERGVADDLFNGGLTVVKIADYP